MSNINSVALSGFLVADPEVRWTSDDGESSIVRLGISYRWNVKSKDSDEREEKSSIFDIVVYGKFANLVARKLKKLDNLTVHGRIERDDWETDAGEKRSNVKIVAQQIDSEGFFRSKDEDNSTEATAPAAQPAAAPAGSAQLSGNDDLPF